MFSHLLHSFLFTLLTGQLPFHTIAKLSTVRRKRRDVEAEGSSNKLAFSLSLSNMTHYFEVSSSTDIVSPRYVLEEVSEDGHLVTVPSTVKDCYYIQDIRQTGLSAVTVCSHTVVDREGLHQLQNCFVADEDLRGQNVLLLTYFIAM